MLEFLLGLPQVYNKGLSNVTMTPNRWLVQMITELRQCIIYELTLRHFETHSVLPLRRGRVKELKPHFTKVLLLKYPQLNGSAVWVKREQRFLALEMIKNYQRTFSL